VLGVLALTLLLWYPDCGPAPLALPPLPCRLPLQELVAACLHDDHTQHPSFDAIVDTLAGLLEEAERGNLARSTSSASSQQSA
jgi:hypothetical protein